MHQLTPVPDITDSRRESRRERDVYLLYGAAFRDIPHLDDQSRDHHIACPSPDSTLAALCQLTAIRLGAQRCIISLLDQQRQYILAEATCRQSLRPEAPADASLNLWYGNVSIPRSWGLCEQVLDLEPLSDDNPLLIINDCAQSDVFVRRKDALRNLDMRAYACAPLFSPRGTIVGALSVFDNKPWNGFSKDEAVLFRELSSTVVDYLNTYTIKDEYRRGELFTRGLKSFAEGASSLNPFEHSPNRSISPSTAPPGSSSGASSSVENVGSSAREPGKPTQNTSRSKAHPQHIELPRRPSMTKESHRALSARHRSITTLQESILPSNSKAMFSRAANVLMASSDLDGALILDASVVANGSRRASSGPGTGPSTGAEHSSEPYSSKTSSSDEGSSPSSDGLETGRPSSSSSSKMCQILGVATTSHSTVEHGTLYEMELARLFREYPDGRIFSFDTAGRSLSSTENSSSPSPSDLTSDSYQLPQSGTQLKRKRSVRPSRSSNTIRAMFPNARSVAFIPFWDYDRSRWFAGCLCWSNDPSRVLSPSVDLTYFKIFSHSIMRELSRLDGIASNKSKTTFVASISHELRSPLHGILGTLEFFKDTHLDSFQTSMLNSLNACGNTLLDTINHVMDYAKISEPRKIVSSRRIKNSNTIRLSSKPLKNIRHEDAAFDFSLATEEVVEAVFAGSSFTPVRTAMMDQPSTPSLDNTEFLSKRKMCFIILDIDFNVDWIFSFPAGSWRRIVMNIFGNAVRYTKSGYIHVSLRITSPARNTAAPSSIVLTVSDTGSGMSPAFLANSAFQPFSQENPHSDGTGLGLSIVRQIIDTNGGKIEVSSELAVGTRLSVKLSVTRPAIGPEELPQRTSYLTMLSRFKGQRVCVLHRKQTPLSEDTNMSQIDEGRTRFTDALVKILEKQFHMEVVQTTEWSGHNADIVILPEPSFGYLASIRRSRVRNKPAPMTIFIAMDSLEAATLRSDVRVVNKESVCEVFQQPCGPYKLAVVLDRCLDRFEHPDENVEHRPSAATSPRPCAVELLAPQPPLSTLESLSDTDLYSASSRDIPLPTAAMPTKLSVAPSTIASTAGFVNSSTFAEPFPTINIDDTVMSKILITDDNLINRKILVAFMKKHSHQYQEATDGLEALQAYQRSPHQIRAILMDMSMPVMDGMTSTRLIREHERFHHLPPCFIVALTGLASASARLEAWNSGIDHFMTKPINFKALEKLLAKGESRTRKRQIREQKPRKETANLDQEGSEGLESHSSKIIAEETPMIASNEAEVFTQDITNLEALTSASSGDKVLRSGFEIPDSTLYSKSELPTPDIKSQSDSKPGVHIQLGEGGSSGHPPGQPSGSGLE